MAWTLKDTNDRKVVEGILDLATVRAIYRLQEKGIVNHLTGVVREGKESRIIKATDENGKSIIVKIYKIDASQFQKMQKYIIGDKRFAGIKLTKRSLIYNWCKKEYSNLKRARKADVNAPAPIAFIKNILVMESIEDNKGNLAPRLKDIILKNPKSMLDMIIDETKKLYQEAELVHADLSEYNIMIRDNKPVIHDLAQSVHKSHPLAEEFLERDIKNICSYFQSSGIECDPDEIIKKIRQTNK